MDTFISKSPQETEQIAQKIAQEVMNNPDSPQIISLYGNLGVGKTVFAKGFAGFFGLQAEKIKSPTYTFVREHETASKKIYHFDFYRIMEEDDLIRHEVEAILGQPRSISLIEWPERIDHILNQYPQIKITITYKSENERQIDVN